MRFVVRPGGRSVRAVWKKSSVSPVRCTLQQPQPPLFRLLTEVSVGIIDRRMLIGTVVIIDARAHSTVDMPPAMLQHPALGNFGKMRMPGTERSYLRTRVSRKNAGEL